MGKRIHMKGYFINQVDKNTIPEFFGITSSGITYRNNEYFVTDKNPERNLIEYIVDGKGYIECDGKVYAVGQGYTVIIRSNVAVKYYADNDDPYIKLWFTATGSFAEAVLGLLMGNERIAVVKKNTYGIFENLLQSIEKNGVDAKRDSHAFLNVMYAAFNPGNVEKKEKDVSEEGEETDFVDKIRSYIDLFCHDGITVEDAAAHFRISQRYLIEQFKRKYKTTPHKYITQKRMENAKELLLYTNDTVSEISNHLGYCEPGYFSKIFVREFGVSPTEFRRKGKQK